MAEVALHQDRKIKGLALSPSFTAPAEITFDNHSPASALSELDAGLDFDGFELQYLLEPQFADSPMHSNSRLLDGMDQVCSSPSSAVGFVRHVSLASETRYELATGYLACSWELNVAYEGPVAADDPAGAYGCTPHESWRFASCIRVKVHSEMSLCLQVLSSPDLSPIKLPPSSFTTPVKNRTIVNITASSAVSAVLHLSQYSSGFP